MISARAFRPIFLGSFALVIAAVIALSGCRKKHAPHELDASAPQPDASPSSTASEIRSAAPMELAAPRVLPFDERAVVALGGSIDVPREAPLFGTVTTKVLRHMEGALYGAIIDPGRFEKKWFFPHSARSVEPLGDFLLVSANTGLWIVEQESLALRARIFWPPVRTSAAAPDGHAFAVSLCSDEADHCALVVVKFPELTIEKRIEIDAPYKLRFSPDSKLIISASQSKKSVTVYERETQKAIVLDVGDHANEAIGIPGSPDSIGYADDSDNSFVRDFRTGKIAFSTDPLIAAKVGYSLFRLSRRDQNAIAYDDGKDILYSGGDDNHVWTFDHALKGTATLREPIELSGNVDEFLLHPLGLIVATDAPSFHLIGSEGKEVSAFDPWLNDPFRWHARMSRVGNEVVVAVNGLLLKWNPSTTTQIVSTQFFEENYLQDSTHEKDAAYARCHLDQNWECAVLFVVRVKATANAIANPIGHVTFASIPTFIDLPKEGRALVAANDDGHLRVSRISPTQVEAPIDTDAIFQSGIFGRGEGHVGFMEATGKVWEVAASGNLTYVGDAVDPNPLDASITLAYAKGVFTTRAATDEKPKPITTPKGL